MKTRLLKKIRKEYSIYCREEPFAIDFIKTHNEQEISIDKINLHYRLRKLNKNIIKSRWEHTAYYRTLTEAKGDILYDVRSRYPYLGAFNRKRIEREKETKVWYNN